MGNCCSGPAPEVNDLNFQRRKRQANWEKTGVISARDSNLKEWPSVQSLSASARVMDVSHNHLSDIPAWLAEFSALHRLLASSNAISTLPPHIGVLSSLRVLMLDGNAIQTVPNSIGQLTRLEQLSLANNQLTVLPAALGQCQSLMLLDVSSNRLHGLPDALGQCTALQQINASSNQITRISESLSALQRLKTLNLDTNRVTAVPPAVLTGCSALQVLSLHDNPITPDALLATEGYSAFEQRRQQKDSKGMAAGVLLGPKWGDEGVDRRLSPRQKL